MTAAKSLFTELENAVRSGTIDKRVATMKRVTDLFLDHAEVLNEDQVAIFDDVLHRLVKSVEARALQELSRRLAPVRNAPIGVVQELAHHDDIAVAGPVLSKSERLTSADLVEIAKYKGQEHLLAISSRRKLVHAVTDALLERGDKDVFCSLAKNSGASFSQAGFTALIDRAKDDEPMAEHLCRRMDVPPQMINKLVATATQAVRIKLLAVAPRELHAEIKAMLATISRDVIDDIKASHIEPDEAKKQILVLKQKGQLNEPLLCEFAKNGEITKLTAGLAQLASAQYELIDRLMRTLHYGGLLVACKAADLRWDLVESVLIHRHPNQAIAAIDLEHAKSDYAELTKSTSIRMLGFWHAQASTRPQ